MKHFYLFALICFPVCFSFGQGSSLPLGNDAYHMLDRLEIKTGLPTPYHSSLKYYQRGAVTRYALTIDTSLLILSSRDRRDLYYIFKDNNEWLGQAFFATTVGGRREYADPERQLTQIELSMEDSRYIESRKPFLKWFYRTPANLFEVN